MIDNRITIQRQPRQSTQRAAVVLVVVARFQARLQVVVALQLALAARLVHPRAERPIVFSFATVWRCLRALWLRQRQLWLALVLVRVRPVQQPEQRDPLPVAFAGAQSLVRPRESQRADDMTAQNNTRMSTQRATHANTNTPFER